MSFENKKFEIKSQDNLDNRVLEATNLLRRIEGEEVIEEEIKRETLDPIDIEGLRKILAENSDLSEELKKIRKLLENQVVLAKIQELGSDERTKEPISVVLNEQGHEVIEDVTPSDMSSQHKFGNFLPPVLAALKRISRKGFSGRPNYASQVLKDTTKLRSYLESLLYNKAA